MPSRAVLMYVISILDVTVVKVIDIDPFLAMRSPQQLDKVVLELSTIIRNDFIRVLSYNLHLSDMGFGESVLFECIFILGFSISTMR